LVVNDLKIAMQKFESAGFTLTEGGINGPTHNALIVFSDGTYIELIAVRSARTRRLLKIARSFGLFKLRRMLRSDLRNRLFSWLSGPEGLTDMCFRGVTLDKLTSQASGHEDRFTEAVSFTRHRPDGVTVAWRLVGAIDLRQPFFIEDKTPLNYRVPDGESRRHVNGALGISEIYVPESLSYAISNARVVVDTSIRTGAIAIGVQTDLEECHGLPVTGLYNGHVRFLSAKS
jgi:hypothetical protein